MSAFSFYIGIDPGYANIGTVLLNRKGELLDATTIKTSPRQAMHLRLEAIVNHFQEVPDCAVCYERQPHHTSVDVSMALGYLLCVLKPSFLLGVPPARIRKITMGSAKVDKKDIRLKMEERFPGKLKSYHQSDAALCATYIFDYFS